jgi:transcriptional regulator with XRE-family HTH domain
MYTIGDYLRKIRTDWGRSLGELSTYCGISIDYLSKIEKGQRKPSKELLTDISKYFNIPFESLWDIYLTDEMINTLDRSTDKEGTLKLFKNRMKKPDVLIHIPNSSPFKKDKKKRRYTKGGVGGKVKGLNYYIQSNGKLKRRERKDLLEKAEVFILPVTGYELDPSLTDIELLGLWNEFFDAHGMRYPEFEDQWFKENPIPDNFKEQANDNSDDYSSNKIELPDFLKKKKRIDTSDLG